MKRRRTRLAGSPGFTLLEIAICLAIIGFAIVAVLGVLPTGLNIQRDTRERTVVMQDASYLLEAIRTGARGTNDLAQYVQGIWRVQQSGSSVNAVSVGFKDDPDIIHLLTEPRVAENTNHLYTVALLRSLTGSASEKGPDQGGDRIAFGYFVRTEVHPVQSVPPDAFQTQESSLELQEARQRSWQYSYLQGNLYELRLSVMWPAFPVAYKPDWVPRNQVNLRTYVGGSLTTNRFGQW